MSEFDYLDRAAPRIPGDTCPAIDSAIGGVESAISALQDLVGRKGALEALRAENSALRECGIYWRDSAKDLAKQIDVLEDEAADLRAERSNLLSEIRELENQLRARDAA